MDGKMVPLNNPWIGWNTTPWMEGCWYTIHISPSWKYQTCYLASIERWHFLTSNYLWGGNVTWHRYHVSRYTVLCSAFYYISKYTLLSFLLDVEGVFTYSQLKKHLYFLHLDQSTHQTNVFSRNPSSSKTLIEGIDRHGMRGLWSFDLKGWKGWFVGPWWWKRLGPCSVIGW